MASVSFTRTGAATRAILVAAVLLSVGVAAGFWVMRQNEIPATPTAAPPAPASTGVPLFTGWPEGQAPDLAIVMTGQTYGYLSPCGCSRPQKGGLERRANFMDSLRKKGWPVIGIDLGDIATPPSKGVQKQNLLKYKYSMKSLAAMGYVAVGLGEFDFASQLFELLSEYTLNNANKPPIVLAANLLGVQRNPDGTPTRVYSRAEYFPGDRGARPMVEGYEVSVAEGRPAVGIVAAIGPTVWKKIEKLDSQFGFADNTVVLKDTLAAIAKHPAKPKLLVLMYQGSQEEAKAAAEAFPQFQLVLCQSEDSEPPQFPVKVNGGKTSIVQVGHKGQNVGVIGAYRNPQGGFDLKYQLVPMGEEYLTPNTPEAAAKNVVLQLLEDYTAEVKSQNLLALFTARPLQHPAQIQHPEANLTYVGADRCTACHPNEFAIWSKTKHAHAYDALVDLAKRPGNRQFDGECVSCHTTGFEYKTGFTNAVDTDYLKHNSCENCHGPGSGHVSQPTNKAFLASMMPWRLQPTDRLPKKEVLEEIGKMKPIDRGNNKLTAKEQLMVNAVSGLCMKCHDSENDPHFDFYTYFPQVYHSGFKAVAK